MKKFLDDNFLLESKLAELLYHDFAEAMPIIDYHNHLIPAQVAENKQFENITQAWLYGDHYKWRAMRAHGIREQFITGDATDKEKFSQWAKTVPYTMRNPLYHWTHLELQRYFGITSLLSDKSADAIYEKTQDLLQTEDYAVQGLLRKMNVEVICTTDDPVDGLEYHQRYAAAPSGCKMIPAFRPDTAMDIGQQEKFNGYVASLEQVTGMEISDVHSYLEALKSRHDYFAALGCKISDHGLEHMYADDFTDEALNRIFQKVRKGHSITLEEIAVFKSGMLYYFALWDHEKGWVQQYHLGALRNNNSRMLQKIGPDTGWDSIGDYPQGIALSRFLNRLDATDQLAKTIIYNLNPADNALFAAMVGNFNDGTVAGKVQLGAAWWFLDQKDGISKQINALSNMGLVSHMVGMLTDSRSFLSFPRHEYFRRILCNIFALDMMHGELPNDTEWIGKIIQDICYYNAKNYFRL